MRRNGTGIVVLLVDDDPDCRLLMGDAIAQSGVPCVVHELDNGRDAVDFVFRRGRFAASPRPDLIFLDIEMPGLSGQDVLAAVKSCPDHQDIPVVMMTGLCDEEQMQRAARNGANSYTVKPVDADQFLHAVQTSARYWTSIHQHPRFHLAAHECRR
jgi:CheY-like chemotaxis protein